MKLTRTLMIALSLSALLAACGGNAFATTLTFADSPGNNSDLPFDYGSFVAADSAAYVTSDGTGATPGIGIAWGPMIPNVLEFHAAQSFVNAGLDVPILQLDCDASNQPGGMAPPDPSIDFTVPAGSQLAIHGLDFGNASDQPAGTVYSWTVNVVKVSDDSVVATHDTPGMVASDFYHMDIDFLGEVGESYRLQFDDGGDDQVRTGIDNISFSQIVPEPSAWALLTLGLLAFVARRRR